MHKLEVFAVGNVILVRLVVSKLHNRICIFICLFCFLPTVITKVVLLNFSHLTHLPRRLYVFCCFYLYLIVPWKTYYLRM